jgi:hypothetical protein
MPDGWVDTGNGWVEEIGTPSRGEPIGPLTEDVARAWSEEFPPPENRFNIKPSSIPLARTIG